MALLPSEKLGGGTDIELLASDELTLVQQSASAEYKYAAYGNDKSIQSLDNYRYLILTVAAKQGNNTWFQFGSVMGTVQDFITGTFFSDFIFNVMQNNQTYMNRPQAVYKSKTSVALQMYSGASGDYKVNLYGIK